MIIYAFFYSWVERYPISHLNYFHLMQPYSIQYLEIMLVNIIYFDEVEQRAWLHKLSCFMLLILLIYQYNQHYFHLILLICQNEVYNYLIYKPI